MPASSKALLNLQATAKNHALTNQNPNPHQQNVSNISNENQCRKIPRRNTISYQRQADAATIKQNTKLQKYNMVRNDLSKLLQTKEATNFYENLSTPDLINVKPPHDRVNEKPLKKKPIVGPKPKRKKNIVTKVVTEPIYVNSDDDSAIYANFSNKSKIEFGHCNDVNIYNEYYVDMSGQTNVNNIQYEVLGGQTNLNNSKPYVNMARQTKLNNNNQMIFNLNANISITNHNNNINSEKRFRKSLNSRKSSIPEINLVTYCHNRGDIGCIYENSQSYKHYDLNMETLRSHAYPFTKNKEQFERLPCFCNEYPDSRREKLNKTVSCEIYYSCEDMNQVNSIDAPNVKSKHDESTLYNEPTSLEDVVFEPFDENKSDIMSESSSPVKIENKAKCILKKKFNHLTTFIRDWSISN